MARPGPGTWPSRPTSRRPRAASRTYPLPGSNGLTTLGASHSSRSAPRGSRRRTHQDVVIGVRGRHSSGVPASTTVVLAVAGVALLIAAAVVAVFTLGGSGARPPRHGAAAATETDSTSGPPAAATAAATSSPAPRPAASHHDPLGSAAASYVSSRDGVVLAAVYDLHTGQTWRFGRGQPQDE